jgi:drug/metabolite transporter (DMT)-like permease
MKKPAGNLSGILAMLGGCFFFVLNDVTAKLASSELPIGQIVFLRGAVSCAVMGLVLAATGDLARLGGLLYPRVVLRSLADTAGSIIYLPALFNLPIGLVQAINQTTPLAITAGAALFLREPVGWRRWTAIAVGFIGVLIIVRPGLAGFSFFALFALAGVMGSTTRDLITSRIPPQIPGVVITASSALLATLGGAILALLLGERWPWPGPHALAATAASGVFLMAGYFLVIFSLRNASVSTVAPFRYSLVIYAMVSGFLVWGEHPDLQTLAGTAVIIASGLYLLHRERLRHRTIAETATR